MSKPVSRVCNVRVAGPLAPFAADFTSRLEELGYTPLTRVNELRLMAHLSRWLEASQLTGADLDGERIGLFLSAQRAGGYGAPGAAEQDFGGRRGACLRVLAAWGLRWA